jgi:hypothetical protein
MIHHSPHGEVPYPYLIANTIPQQIAPRSVVFEGDKLTATAGGEFVDY